MHTNYNLLMENEIKSLDGRVPTLLLHACCAPCSSACIERLGNYFKITIFYYNPNITSKIEYNKRLDEVKRFIKEFKVKYPIEILDAKYDPENFLSMTKGLEDLPERSERCYKCYEMRLKETFKVAEEKNFDYFATTLTLSPYKNAEWLNEIGERISKDSHTKYLYSEFKKKDGYKRSIVLSKIYNLYRQDYCGCSYSKKNKEILN